MKNNYEIIIAISSFVLASVWDIIKSVTADYISHKIKPKLVDDSSKLNQEETFIIDIIESPEKPLSYMKQVSRRLLKSIDLVTLQHDNVLLSKISYELNYSPVSIIEDYFNGEAEPSSNFLKDYADYYGFNIEWLRHGTGHIFIKHNKNKNFTSPKAYVKEIESLQPEQIFFVRSTGENGETGIFLKLTKTKFIILPDIYRLSINVGGAGQSRIEEFYELIKEIAASHSLRMPNGLILDNSEFRELFMGRIYAGKIVDCNRQNSWWWDDFLDIKHEFPISENYENLYGIEFVKAQEIVVYRKGLRNNI